MTGFTKTILLNIYISTNDLPVKASLFVFLQYNLDFRKKKVCFSIVKKDHVLTRFILLYDVKANFRERLIASAYLRFLEHFHYHSLSHN
jgi:hypothetical protein